MFCLGTIKINQILVLIEILNTASLLSKDIIKDRFLRRANNFDETVAFLEELELIRCDDNNIFLTNQYNALKKNNISQREGICTFILNYLLKNKTSLSEYLNEFLSHFIFIGDKYQFIPSTFHRLHYSELRNLLIELGLIYLDQSNKKYIITSDYGSKFSEYIERQKLTQDEYYKKQQRRKEIGDAAELEIIQYEQQRLAQYPNIVERIEHTAKYDLLAGYDIKSFDEQNKQFIPRYIEVKAVPFSSYHFIWSRNEIEKSELFRNRYFLYLLPVKNDNEFYIEKLIMINDPYINILKNNEKWQKTIESMSFVLSDLFDNSDLSDRSDVSDL